MMQGEEWGMIHAPGGGGEQHPSGGPDMDVALAKGGGAEAKIFFAISFAEPIFAKGMRLKINIFLRFIWRYNNILRRE